MRRITKLLPSAHKIRTQNLSPNISQWNYGNCLVNFSGECSPFLYSKIEKSQTTTTISTATRRTFHVSRINPNEAQESQEDEERREIMEYDVVVVGGGPSGLSAAIRLKQLAQEKGADFNVCLLEKGQEIAAHTLSGAVLETRSLKELFPDLDLDHQSEDSPPLHTKVTRDKMLFLTETRSFPLPIIPDQNNHKNGNYIISLGQLCKWLAAQAEALGVEIFPGFAASEVIYGEKGEVKGIATKDFGIGKDGQKTESYQRGIEIHAKQTIFAEGCRGSLTRTLFENDKFKLREGVQPQTYGLGVKEIWEIDPSVHEKGFVMHTLGWPLDSSTYGGSWMYHYEENKLSLGFVVALDYMNPTLSPYQEFQRFKHHPAIKPYLQNGTCIQYGARTISEGGLQSLPKLHFPGGILVGDAAGFLNVPKIKGIHAAMKSGMLGAESVFDTLEKSQMECDSYTERFKSSWLYEELHRVRNIRPYFKYGLYPGLALAGLDALIFKGKLPFTLSHHGPDNAVTKSLDKVQKIQYPKPDGKISFDLLTNLARSGTNHNHNQPSHLTLKDKSVPVNINLKVFGGPEQYYCPAKVYEFVEGEGNQSYLQINAQNCLHCKACDIKDPKQNIVWTTPEGGGGPAYLTM